MYENNEEVPQTEKLSKEEKDSFSGVTIEENGDGFQESTGRNSGQTYQSGQQQTGSFRVFTNGNAGESGFKVYNLMPDTWLKKILWSVAIIIVIGILLFFGWFIIIGIVAFAVLSALLSILRNILR